VDADQAAAAIIVPAGFSESVIPVEGATAGDVAPIALYANPTRPTSVGVIRTIVDEFVGRVETGRIAGQVVATQLAGQGLAQVQDAMRIGGEAAAQQATAPRGTLIALRSSAGSAEPREFDALAYMAPGMALMFLMFTVANGGRTLLAERAQGTLPRLLVSPTPAAQVLAGKVFGIYLTGVVQMLILILASTLLFRLSWGDPLAVLVLVLAAVLGATGWGMLITALAKTPGQVSAVGSAMMLTFGILGGSFINPDVMPRWFQVLSRITPNAWGLDGFTNLAMGGGLADILGPVVALPAMGALLFGVALLVYNRRGLAQA
jgi:ABC-2 type transport system permease protein